MGEQAAVSRDAPEQDAPEAARAPRGLAAVALVGVLTGIYAVSQFLRNALGVIAPDLARELGLSATDIGLLSSAFFLTFAMAQIPVGIAIDRYGPRVVMLVCAAVAVAGCVLFALAPNGAALVVARMLLGLGCSSFFMGPLAIYARSFPPERFAAITGVQLGAGSLGTLIATAPLAMAVAAVGWRASFLAVAVFAGVAGLLVAVGVRPGSRPEGARETWRQAVGGVREAVATPSFWPVFLVHGTVYAVFGTVVGLWAGPWLTDSFGFGLEARGAALFAASVAQVSALFVWGTADRLFGGYKLPVLIGGGATLLCLLAATLVSFTPWGAQVWLVCLGVSVAVTPMVMAHGKALFPSRLTGRGITLMNIGTMGGVFVMQTLTGVVMDAFGRTAAGGYPDAAYRSAFVLLAIALASALVFYSFAPDPRVRYSHEGDPQKK